MSDADIKFNKNELVRKADELAATIRELRKVEAERDEARALVRTEQLRYLSEIERLRKERDEARREVCNLMHQTGFLNGDYACERGWDCFKRDDGACRYCGVKDNLDEKRSCRNCNLERFDDE